MPINADAKNAPVIGGVMFTEGRSKDMKLGGSLSFPESMTATFQIIKDLRTKRDEWRYSFMPDEEYSTT
jgi:hypothetical protein